MKSLGDETGLARGVLKCMGEESPFINGEDAGAPVARDPAACVREVGVCRGVADCDGRWEVRPVGLDMLGEYKRSMRRLIDQVESACPAIGSKHEGGARVNSLR